MNLVKKTKEKWNSIPLPVKVSFSYAVCSILQKCLSFITLPLFTRILSTEQYGQYTVYSSWSGIIMIFLTLNLAYGSFSTAMVKFENKRDEYIASVEGICLLLSVAFLIIYLPFCKLWNKLFELPTFLIVLMVVEILAQTGIQLWSGKKRFEFKYKSVIAVTLATSVVAPIIAYLFVISTKEKGIARIIGYAVVIIVIGGTIFFKNAIKGRYLYNKVFWKYAFGFNIPLLAYYLSQMIFNQSDRIMISHITGTSDAAMYGVAYNLAMVLTFVLNAINNAYVPWYYGKIKEGRQKENQTISCAIAGIMSALLLVVIWFAPEIILIMAGKQYMAAIWVVPPVAMSLLLLFYSQLFINVDFYFEEKKALVSASIGAALVNIVLNASLIPVFGFIAAGYTTLFSYVVFAVANYFTMKKVLKQHHIDDTAFNYKGLIEIAIVFTIFGFLGVFLYDYLVLRVVIIAVLLIVTLINSKKILSNLKLIRGKY